MKKLLLLAVLFSVSSYAEVAEIKERYEISFHKALSHERDSYYIMIQDGKLVTEKTIDNHSPHCEIRLGYGDEVKAGDPASIVERPSVFETEQGLFRHMYMTRDFSEKLRSLDCYLPTEEVDLELINRVLSPIASVQKSDKILKEDLDDKKLRSACEMKVIDYHAGVYHRTFKAANNTFLNNFIGRKNAWAHVWGAPKVAFLQLGLITNNYLADNIVAKSKKSKEVVYEKYITLLRTGKLCKDMGKDFKKPRKIRKYLLNELKNS